MISKKMYIIPLLVLFITSIFGSGVVQASNFNKNTINSNNSIVSKKRVNKSNSLSKSRSVSRSNARSNSSVRSSNSAGVNIDSNDSTLVLPEYAEYMPDNGPNANVFDFEWHRSAREIRKDNKDSNRYHQRRMDNTEARNLQRPAYSRYKDLRLVGLSDTAAKARLQYELGVSNREPIIINGHVRGFRLNGT